VARLKSANRLKTGRQSFIDYTGVGLAPDGASRVNRLRLKRFTRKGLSILKDCEYIKGTQLPFIALHKIDRFMQVTCSVATHLPKLKLIATLPWKLPPGGAGG
jgi:hypothetical protein